MSGTVPDYSRVERVWRATAAIHVALAGCDTIRDEHVTTPHGERRIEGT
jgi:hypothetical protein